jgi:mannose-6-phosphate isomerase
LWLDAGWDREYGGFVDKLDQEGRPVPLAKRVRVQARQIFCYAQAGLLGWNGPWQRAVEQGTAFMLDAYRRSDGLFRKSVEIDGSPADDMPDLYDQAFIVFALAWAYAVMDRPEALQIEAIRLLETLDQVATNPHGGYKELGSTPAPLRSNPHMHMLEALLAWVENGGKTDFATRSRGIVDLATRNFLDPATGAVGEYFDIDWSFAPGQPGTIREPGHQFEWAYLLDEADRRLGGDHRQASARLYAFGTEHGIQDGRTIFSNDAHGAALDSSSRLWAQTERLRTALILGAASSGAADDKYVLAAMQGFDWTWRMLDVPVRGLWRDRTTATGATIDEPAPASSLYHIMTGFLPLMTRGAT